MIQFTVLGLDGGAAALKFAVITFGWPLDFCTLVSVFGTGAPTAEPVVADACSPCVPLVSVNGVNRMVFAVLS